MGRNWQPPLKTYKLWQKCGCNAQALIWDVLDDGELSGGPCLVSLKLNWVLC